ncbi:hypothetical protein ACP4OV_014363 [Aristida adscensionis]
MAAAGWFVALAGAVAAAVAVALLPAARSTAETTTPSARPVVPQYADPPPASSSSSPAAALLDCGTVTSLLASCGDFVWHGAAAAPLPSPGTPCCEGVAQLYDVAADSPDNWRAVCRCMVGLVARHSSNASAIALLPVLCGVLPGRHAVDALPYCSSSPWHVQQP